MTAKESELTRPDMPFDELVTVLRDIIGVRLVGFIGGEARSSAVSDWADGHSAPSEKDQERLRYSYDAAALLERYDDITVQSWFKGQNPSLGMAPAQLLREGDPTEAGREVLAAAKAFAYIG
ncbi:hypothetical protein [Leifsonia sp. EB34]|uniref:hypothetical protein n=1 Tax=Leifsonia sp. EB34 TaxID=3156303 RepID=UPI0035116FCC